MKLPDESIAKISDLIKGRPLPGHAKVVSAAYTIGWIGGFFQKFGGDGLYPPDHSPDAEGYVYRFLQSVNGTPSFDELLVALPTFCADDEHGQLDPNAVAYELNNLIEPNGIRLRKEGASFQGFSGGEFVLVRTRREQIEVVSLIELDDQSIMEHVEKASSKIEGDDFAGAISSSYTLIEGFLKRLLETLGVIFNQNEGDIRELYKLVSEPLNLNPARENLESYLKSILQGLKQQVSGLYELANKASDRHARRYNPARHHAKLAVNAAFTLCEFLLDSYEYQNQRKERKSAS
jgi:hypothetical protein